MRVRTSVRYASGSMSFSLQVSIRDATVAQCSAPPSVFCAQPRLESVDQGTAFLGSDRSALADARESSSEQWVKRMHDPHKLQR
jgi:hypothetical protein